MINFFTTDHVVELYSTGCTKKDCNGAVGMIKMDGTQLGGGVDGMNIVVLSFPGMIDHYAYLIRYQVSQIF